MGWRENPEPKNPKPNWNPPPQKAKSICTGTPINKIIYNLSGALCTELKHEKKKRSREIIENVMKILPQLITIAERNPKRRIELEDLQKLYKSEEIEP